MKIKSLSILLILGTAFLHGGWLTYSRSEYREQPPEVTGDGWEVSAPDAEGLGGEVIRTVMQNLHRERYGMVQSLVIVKNGKLVLESYADGYDREKLFSIQSATKSVTSLLVGIADDRGLLPTLDTSLFEALPERVSQYRTPEKAAITLRHALTMTTGLAWREPGNYLFFNPWDDAVRANYSRDPPAYLLRKPLEHPPGREFLYNSAVSMTLAEVVKVATGMPIDRFAEEALFAPLGIKDYRWIKHWRWRGDYPHTGGGLYLRARDLAKIGQMVLDHGRWQDKQVVSEAWIEASTKPSPANPEYGFQWWLRTFEHASGPVRVIYMLGFRGQYVFIVPKLQSVVVLNGSLTSPRPANAEALMSDLVPAWIKPT